MQLLVDMAWGQSFMWSAIFAVSVLAGFLFRDTYIFISSQHPLWFWFIYLEQESEMVQFTLVPSASLFSRFFLTSFQGLFSFSRSDSSSTCEYQAHRKNFCFLSFIPWNIQSARNHIVSPSSASSLRDKPCMEIKTTKLEQTQTVYSEFAIARKSTALTYCLEETQRQLGE